MIYLLVLICIALAIYFPVIGFLSLGSLVPNTYDFFISGNIKFGIIFLIIDIVILYRIINWYKINMRAKKLKEENAKRMEEQKKDESKEKIHESFVNNKSHIDNLISKVKLKKYN